MAMEFSTLFATDQDAEENGKWFKDIAGEESGVDVKLRRMTSKTVERALARIMRENRHRMVDGKFAEAIDLELGNRLLAEAVIVDWRGIIVGGDAVTYSPEAAADLLTRFPEFGRHIRARCGNMDLFRAETAQATEKNS